LKTDSTRVIRSSVVQSSPWFSLCDFCCLLFRCLSFGCGSAALGSMRPFAANPWLKKNFINSAVFPPVGFPPSWKCDQLLGVSTNLPAHRSFSVGGSIAPAGCRVETAACRAKATADDQVVRVKAWIMSVARDRSPRLLAKADACGPTAATAPAALSAPSVRRPASRPIPNKLETLITRKPLDILLNY